MNSPCKSPLNRPGSPIAAMRIDFLILGMSSNVDLRKRLASDLQALTHLIPIERAHISLERQHLATPPFQAIASLVVPGPDLHAAARDHTWPAAWQKVLARLREQVDQRRSQQARRKKTRPRRQCPAAPRTK